jgi:hypothetical protein
MGRHSDQNHAADLTGWAWFAVLLFTAAAVVEDKGVHRGDRTQQGAAERQFVSARPIGQKAELPDAHKAAGQDMQ